MMTIHRPGQSVSRSVGHTGEGRYVLAAAACATAFIWNQLTYPEGFYILSLGAPSRPAVTRQGSGCQLVAREKMPHLTGSTAGGQPAGVVVSVVVFPTPLGLPPPNVEPVLL